MLDAVAGRLGFFLAGDGLESRHYSAVAEPVQKLDQMVHVIIQHQVWDASRSDHGNTSGQPLVVHSIELGYSGTYFDAPLTLARAWRCPMSRYYRQAEVLERLIASLSYVERFIRPSAQREGGWYAWDIGIPKRLSQTMLLCRDQLPAKLKERLMEALFATPFMAYTANREHGAARSTGSKLPGGSNAMEILMTLLLRGALAGDRQWADCAAAQVPVAMGVSPEGEGIQSDWSFHFHGRGVNAAYGHVCLFTQALWIYLTHGTPWQCEKKELENHFGVLRHFFCLNTWRGRLSPYSLDRTIARANGIYGVEGAEYLASLLLSLNSQPSEGDRRILSATVVDWMNGMKADQKVGGRDGPDLSTSLLLSRISDVMKESVSISPCTRFYPLSDYLLVRRRGWFAAVLMSSTRTSSWKSIGGEHIHGSSMAEFSIALMTDGREFDHTTVPTMDWRRLMGVTCCDAIESPPEGYGQSAFVSGLTGDDFAVLGMQYLLAPPGQGTLRANKSLFVTDDAVVFLGNRVVCDSDEKVVTTLFHAPIQDGACYRRGKEELDVKKDQTLELGSGEMLFCRNAAIRLLTPARLILSQRCGSYREMNHPQAAMKKELKDAHDEIHQHRWIYVVVDHGIRPASGSYGAVLWPGVKADFVPAWDGLCIEQETDRHLVCLKGRHMGGEVRFPIDWRIPEGFSFFGAEPHKWGSLAHWCPIKDSNKLRLTVLPPLRHLRDPERATEVVLPKGMQARGGPAKTLDGRPWPANLLPISANGKAMTLEVERVD